MSTKLLEFGPFDVPSAKLDALAIKATDNIDRVDTPK